ncbi:MAG: GINS complex subunit [Sclerophora amabilis]|nr:MAG: GINS complex subunit [Sclerophora amabilis]
MDIDDILTTITHENHDDDDGPSSTGANGTASAERDLQDLTRAWVAERVGPEILPFREGVVGRVVERLRGQVEQVEMQTGNMDPKTNFRLIIIQTEVERVKFLVRSYLRARIAKIDKYALHILRTPALRSCLSPPELQYLTQHQALLHHHYLSSFLHSFPDKLRRLDDTAGGISMIEQPDLDVAVFCRVLRDVQDPVVIQGTDTVFELRRGGVHVVRYSAVRDAILRGDVELI